MRFILASASPRRQELLRRLVPEFEVIPADVDEDALTVADPWKTAELLAAAKARAVFRSNQNAAVIGGDTVVAIETSPGEWRHLAKPSSVGDAEGMLRALSGREHVVITGISVIYSSPGAESESQVTVSDTTRVRFRALSDAEIGAYVATGEPMDKAGGYAIQGGAEGFVESIDGSWSNVVGLPLETLERVLGELRLRPGEAG